MANNPTCVTDGDIEQPVACVPGAVGTTCPTDAKYSTCGDLPAEICYTAWCNDAFVSLPKAKRIDVIGTNGKCMYKFDTSNPGMILSDGKGGFVFTDSPALDLPQLVGYVTEADGSIQVDQNRTAIEGDPPGFGYIMVQKDDDGEWMKLRGKPDTLSMIVWDGTEFKSIGMDEANLSVSRPAEECDEGELVAFPTPECDSGEPNILKRLAGTTDGVLFFSTLTGKTKITSICDVYVEEGVRSTRMPFIPGCSDGQGIRFRGPTDKSTILYWDFATNEWAIMDMDSQLCDPECNCSTYLTPVFDCVTNTWSITEAPDHIETWKTWTDSGVNTAMDITLKWPALVTIYALRRIIPNHAENDTYSADIYVDTCKKTSPSDGGLVGSFHESSSSTGMAIVPLEAGDHNIYVSGTEISDGASPLWNGAWMKVVAHKIVGCDQPSPGVGAGVIQTGYAGMDGDCDCAPGATGPTGLTGSQGEQGVPGVPGIPGAQILYEVDTCPHAHSLIWKTEIENDPDVTKFFFKSLTSMGPCITIEAEDPCSLLIKMDERVVCLPEHSSSSTFDPNETYIPSVTPDGNVIHNPVFTDPPGGNKQYWLTCQETDGGMSSQNLNFPSPSGSDQYFALCQDSSGDVTVVDLCTAMGGCGSGFFFS